MRPTLLIGVGPTASTDDAAAIQRYLEEKIPTHDILVIGATFATEVYPPEGWEYGWT